MDTRKIQKIAATMHQIGAFAMYGTLLGCIRNGAVIPWDKDIDYSILSKNHNQAIEEQLTSEFEIQRIDKWPKSLNKYLDESDHDKICKIKLKYEGVKICFDILALSADKQYHCYYSRGIPTRMGRYEIGDLIEKELNGTPTWVPSNYEDLLKFIYGDNWMIPNKDYIGSDEHRKNSNRFYRKIKP